MSFAGKKVVIETYALDIESAILATQLKSALEMDGIVVDKSGIASVGDGGGGICGDVHIDGKDASFVEAMIKAVGKFQTVIPHVCFPGGTIRMKSPEPIFPTSEADDKYSLG